MSEQTKLSITLDGETLKMPVSFRAWQMLSEEIGDPINLLRRWEKGDQEWLNSKTVIDIIRIGLEAGGHSYTSEQIGESIFGSKDGMRAYVDTAGIYVAAFVGGSGSVPASMKGGGTSKKSKGSSQPEA